MDADICKRVNQACLDSCGPEDMADRVHSLACQLEIELDEALRALDIRRRALHSLDDDNARMVMALRFYADPTNYMGGLVFGDSGRIAREALERD